MRRRQPRQIANRLRYSGCFTRGPAITQKNCHTLRRLGRVTDYNADRSDLFTIEGLKYLGQVKVTPEDRFVLNQLTEEWKSHVQQLGALDTRLREFAKSAPAAEAEARAVLNSIPYVGPVTIDAVVSELGDVRRFRSQKRAAADSGLVPGQRESAGRRRETGITKEGSRILRWALVETAWRLVYHSRRWGSVFEALCKRRGKKRAIIAVARRLLCMMVAMLQSGRRYQAERGQIDRRRRREGMCGDFSSTFFAPAA